MTNLDMNKDIIMQISPYEQEESDTGVIDDTTLPSRVILFNDDWHSFDEVITQIMKAVKCSQDRAESLTTEVHEKGKACVFEGEMGECIKVSSVLEEIALHTQIEM